MKRPGGFPLYIMDLPQSLLSHVQKLQKLGFGDVMHDGVIVTAISVQGGDKCGAGSLPC